MKNIPFQTIDWSGIAKEEHKGESGSAFWQIRQFEGLRIRLVEYSPGYLADHWCLKGHIVHCLEGEFISELSSGEEFTLTPGMTYIVSDELSSHRSKTEKGVKLLIIDGDFLKTEDGRRRTEDGRQRMEDRGSRIPNPVSRSIHEKLQRYLF